MDERDVVHQLKNLQRTLLTRAPLRHSIVAVERGDGAFRWSDAIGEPPPLEPFVGTSRLAGGPPAGWAVLR